VGPPRAASRCVFFDTASRTQRVINVGRVHGYGVEAQVTVRPSRYFHVNGNVAYARTVKRGDRDCTLRDCGGLPNPTWASSGVATLHYPVRENEAYLSGEWSYQGKARQAYDWRGITRRHGYTTATSALATARSKGGRPTFTSRTCSTRSTIVGRRITATLPRPTSRALHSLEILD
jgi:iron complex outermembrane receptor protein